MTEPLEEGEIAVQVGQSTESVLQRWRAPVSGRRGGRSAPGSRGRGRQAGRSRRATTPPSPRRRRSRSRSRSRGREGDRSRDRRRRERSRSRSRGREGDRSRDWRRRERSRSRSRGREDDWSLVLGRRRERSCSRSRANEGDRSQERGRRRERSHSQDRPAAVPAPSSALHAAHDVHAQLQSLASSVCVLTQAVALSDCLKDIGAVCERLEEAVGKACTFCDMAGKNPPGDACSRGISELGSCIFRGLRSLHVFSNTGRGRDMPCARAVVQRAWLERERLFSAPQVVTLEGWAGSRNFGALLETAPAAEAAAPRPAMPAPALLAATPGKRGGKGRAGNQGAEAQAKLERSAPQALPPAQELRLAEPILSSEPGRKGAQQPAPHAGDALSESAAAAAADARGIVPGSPVDLLLRARKLCLVLDLDHTLLNSAMFTELNPRQGQWLEARAAAQAQLPPEQRDLFRLDAIKMFTKLRPGVRQFLREASQLFELWIHTNGNRLYAAAVIQLLDPGGDFFGVRVIAQGAERPEEMQRDQPKVLELGLAERDAVSVIVDDSLAVWAAHAHNLVPVERYVYFPPSATALGIAGRSLLEQSRDDNPGSGVLMATLGALRRVHATVFAALDAPPRRLPSGEVLHANWDVRHVLNDLRQGVLRGAHLVFSRVIPLGQPPETHELWQLAVRFGARCGTQVGEATHVVAGAVGTDKAMQARAARKFVVSKAWLQASCREWRRADEKQYPVA